MLSGRTTRWLEEMSRPYCTQKGATNLRDVNYRDKQITDQIDVLNSAFSRSGSGISWVLAGTTRTTSADWFNNVGPGNAQQTAMKKALRLGGARDLNVYTVGLVAPLNILDSH